MKNRYIILSILSIFSIFQFSCNDAQFFDEANPPANDIIGQVNTTKDLENLLNGAYFAFNGDGGGGLVDWVSILSDLSSDITQIHLDGQDVYSWDYFVVYNHETDNDDFRQINNIWLAGYSTIEASNQVIDVINSQLIDDDLADDWQPRIKGEALFLRSFAYFNLIRTFAPPYGSENQRKSIILSTKPSESAFDLKGLSTTEEVYDQIIMDLENAIELLPNSYRTVLDPEGYKVRATKDAARFLLAKVYFQMGQEKWPESLTYIEAILEDQKYPLVENPEDNWLTIGGQAGFTDATSEIVFRYVEYFQSYWRGPYLFRPFGINGRSITDVNTSRSFSLSEDFLNKSGWLEIENAKKDLRFVKLFTRFENDDQDPLDNLQYSKPAVWGNKWLRIKGQAIPMFRSAELYLTKAIILFEQGNFEEAAEALDVVRKRAWNEEVAGSFVETLPEVLTAEDIHIERMREMALEGDRLFYLQALRQDIPPGDREEATLAWDSDKLYWPIPLVEKERNPKLQ